MRVVFDDMFTGWTWRIDYTPRTFCHRCRRGGRPCFNIMGGAGGVTVCTDCLDEVKNKEDENADLSD